MRDETKKKKTEISPETILEDHDIHIQTLAQHLRQLVKATVPEAIEKAYPGWHGIGYRHPKAGYFCCIFPFKDSVKLALKYLLDVRLTLPVDYRNPSERWKR